MLYHYVLRDVSPMMAAAMKSRKRGVPSSVLDRIGIGVSAFCLLQCLALPLALLFAPLASAGLFSHELFHLLLLGVIIPVSLLAFGLGFLRHRNLRMFIPAGAGFALLILAAVLEHGHVIGPVWISLVTSMGGLGLISGHLLNMRSQGG